MRTSKWQIIPSWLLGPKPKVIPPEQPKVDKKLWSKQVLKRKAYLAMAQIISWTEETGESKIQCYCSAFKMAIPLQTMQTMSLPKN